LAMLMAFQALLVKYVLQQKRLAQHSEYIIVILKMYMALRNVH